jgi:hypothetical protein
MNIVQQGHSYAFVLKYFGHGELDKMVGDFVDSPDPFKMEQVWQGMINRLMELHRGGADPEGEEGQRFAADWWHMVEEISRNNPNFLKSAIAAGSDVDNWPEEAGDFKTAIRDFVGKAIGKYVQDNGIQLPT